MENSIKKCSPIFQSFYLSSLLDFLIPVLGLLNINIYEIDMPDTFNQGANKC